jgi:surface polysaccharide O-acyltransferase-like enzyme
MKSDSIVWVDFVRVTASFLVVVIHSAAPLVGKYDNTSAAYWWAGNVYDSLARVCVPLFFMLTGYLLLGKEEPPAEYFKKRAGKLLIPLLVWSIFYVLWKHFVERSETITPSSLYSLPFTPAYYHLWFFYAIIGLYLIVPVLRIIARNGLNGILYYFTALWFIAVAVIPFIEKTAAITSHIDLKMASGHAGYLVLGYIARDLRIDKRGLILALAVIPISLLTTIIGTFFLTLKNNGEFDGYFYDFISPNVIIYSVAVFVILKHILEKVAFANKQKTALTALSSVSFGIYLIHPVILYILKAGWLFFSLDAFSFNAAFGVLLIATLTYTISAVIIFILQKIPLIRYCVP